MNRLEQLVQKLEGTWRRKFTYPHLSECQYHGLTSLMAAITGKYDVPIIKGLAWYIHDLEAARVHSVHIVAETIWNDQGDTYSCTFIVSPSLPLNRAQVGEFTLATREYQNVWRESSDVYEGLNWPALETWIGIGRAFEHLGYWTRLSRRIGLFEDIERAEEKARQLFRSQLWYE